MRKAIIIALGLKGSWAWAFRKMKEGLIVTPMEGDERSIKLRLSPSLLHDDKLQFMFSANEPILWYDYTEEYFSINKDSLWKIYNMKNEPKFKVGDILKIKPGYAKDNPYHTIKITKVYNQYMKKNQYGYKFDWKTSWGTTWMYATHRPEWNLTMEYDYAH